MESQSLAIDQVISELLNFQNKGGNPLSEEIIIKIIELSITIFQSEASLLEIKPPIVIAGDIHGQFFDLLRLFEKNGPPSSTSYLFMGNFVDRGSFSLETIVLLLSYKIKYPSSFYLIRGNHESIGINRIYGFYDECRKKFNIKLWRCFNSCFNHLPLAALVNDKFLCVHSGLSSELRSLDDIKAIKRPTEVPDSGLLCDLLWNDPDPIIEDWDSNDVGVNMKFGKRVLSQFLLNNNLLMVCRAHQVVQNGYEFFGPTHLVTIFSAPNYCGEFQNSAATMCIDSNNNYAFLTF